MKSPDSIPKPHLVPASPPSERHVIDDHVFYLAAPSQRRVLIRLLSDVRASQLLPQCSSACYAVALLVRRFLLARKVRARLVDCTVIIKSGDLGYVIGQGFARPGQIDGHLVCLMNDRVLVDFGLGVVSKHLIPGFPQGVAVSLNKNDPHQLASAKLPNGNKVFWIKAAAPVGKKEFLAEQMPVVNAIYRRWHLAISPPARG